MESYLIDPDLVVAATNWRRADYIGALVAAGKVIREYQIARWAIGKARRALPPRYDLSTRPEECGGNDFRLPGNLTQGAVFDWAKNQIAQYLARADDSLRAETSEQSILEKATVLPDGAFDDPNMVLLWCSGKDLIAALEPWLALHDLPNGGVFRRLMRDWSIANGDQVLERLVEWRALLQMLRE